MNRVLLSSDHMDWETPPNLFEALAAEFGPFDLDAAATHQTAKCARYYTPEVDGLLHPWEGRVWLNPPYGREIGKWVRKAYEEAQAGRATVTLLIPARTDTAYWHDYVMKADVIRFLRGRVRFLRDGQAASVAPFPSAVVVFRAALAASEGES